MKLLNIVRVEMIKWNENENKWKSHMFFFINSVFILRTDCFSFCCWMTLLYPSLAHYTTILTELLCWCSSRQQVVLLTENSVQTLSFEIQTSPHLVKNFFINSMQIDMVFLSQNVCALRICINEQDVNLLSECAHFFPKHEFLCSSSSTSLTSA